MEHPNNEFWMEYIYRELPSPVRRRGDHHLIECARCRAMVDAWRATQSTLDSDGASLVRSPSRLHRFLGPGLLQWAAAAAIGLTIGFEAGRHRTVTADEMRQELARTREAWHLEAKEDRRRMSATIEAESSNRLADENRRMIRDLVAQLSTARVADQMAWARQFRNYEEQRALDYGDLRRDLALLARQTGTGFRQAESQLNLLAEVLPLPTPSDSSMTNHSMDQLH